MRDRPGFVVCVPCHYFKMLLGQVIYCLIKHTRCKLFASPPFCFSMALCYNQAPCLLTTSLWIDMLSSVSLAVCDSCTYPPHSSTSQWASTCANTLLEIRVFDIRSKCPNQYKFHTVQHCTEFAKNFHYCWIEISSAFFMSFVLSNNGIRISDEDFDHRQMICPLTTLKSNVFPEVDKIHSL